MAKYDYYRDREADPARRDIYRERVVEQADAPSDASRDIYQQRTYGPDGEQVVRSEHVSVPSDATQREAGVERARQVIYFIFGFVEALLAMRFVLLLLGANPDSPFVSLIYGLSNPFVLPFVGIFGEPRFAGSVIEWSSLVGIVVYLLVAYGLARIVELVAAPARPSRSRDY
jgi:hypothetical protein